MVEKFQDFFGLRSLEQGQAAATRKIFFRQHRSRAAGSERVLAYRLALDSGLRYAALDVSNGPQAPVGPFGTKRTCATKVAQHGSYLKPARGFSPVRHLRAARTGHENDQGGRRSWIRSDALYLRLAPRRLLSSRRHACSHSKLGKEELPNAFTKRAPFVYTLRRSVPASRYCSLPAEDCTRRSHG